MTCNGCRNHVEKILSQVDGVVIAKVDLGAAGLFYPTFGILLSQMIAALAMSFSSVSVIANPKKLRNIKL